MNQKPSLKEWVEQNKTLTAVLFWGIWIILVWSLMNGSSSGPDLSDRMYPEEPCIEYGLGGGFLTNC